MQAAATVAILAGGKSRRMGRDKSFVLVEGRPMLEHIVEHVRSLDLSTLLVANETDRYAHLGLPVVPDVVPGAGSLGGIYTALSCSATPYTLCVACDMPFLNVDLLAYLLSLRAQADAVVPQVGGYPEALHAVYSRACLPVIRQAIDEKSLRIGRLFQLMDTHFVPEDVLRRYDPALRSFTNINTPEELQQAQTSLAPG